MDLTDNITQSSGAQDLTFVNEIGKFKIYSYGFMLALSFFIGILLAAKRAEKKRRKAKLNKKRRKK